VCFLSKDSSIAEDCLGSSTTYSCSCDIRLFFLTNIKLCCDYYVDILSFCLLLRLLLWFILSRTLNLFTLRCCIICGIGQFCRMVESGSCFTILSFDVLLNYDLIAERSFRLLSNYVGSQVFAIPD
jgi:hypothetical protein